MQGKKILAMKVTKNANQVRDGSRPAVLYSSTQHAREWITPEMNRRLLHYYVDDYATNKTIQRICRQDRTVVRPGREPGRL